MSIEGQSLMKEEKPQDRSDWWRGHHLQEKIEHQSASSQF